VSHEARGERVWTLHVADLTDRRRTEEQLRRAKEAAEAADRAKSDFLATISHELRTPLVGVIGVADLLQDAGATPAQADLLAMLRSSASALLGLISDILDYSRIEAGLLDLKPLAFSVRECIEDAFDAVTELAARKGLDLGYVLLGDVPERVIADQARVRQVLLNLLSNAVKFTDSGEVSVVVSAEATESGELRMRACVNDTGLGIPEHLHDRLFQRFSQIQTGRVKHAGAGLGLAISERLSRLLGGSLSVQSTVNEGSTFTFLFRADADPTLAEAVVADRPLEGRRVLVLGQATIVSRQLHCILQEWGAHVRVASSPDALESAERWDVVIADADRFGGGAMAVVGTLLKVIAPARLLLVSRNRSLAPGDTVGSPILNKPVKAAALRAALESAGIVLRAEAAAVDTVPRAPFAADVLSILLVEDNDANRRVLEAMIRELGLRADVAAGGREAVEATKLTAYDVILMDLQMPDLDGLEATRRIRRLRPDGGGPTIIALTADAVRGEQARWRDAGMDGYLAKPLRLETLAATLLPLVGRKPASN
jgi:CheY-like chemotaxis protein/nitrogen-specific signal transduction histidine kinase